MANIHVFLSNGGHSRQAKKIVLHALPTCSRSMKGRTRPPVTLSGAGARAYIRAFQAAGYVPVECKFCHPRKAT